MKISVVERPIYKAINARNVLARVHTSLVLTNDYEEIIGRIHFGKDDKDKLNAAFNVSSQVLRLESFPHHTYFDGSDVQDIWERLNEKAKKISGKVQGVVNGREDDINCRTMIASFLRSENRRWISIPVDGGIRDWGIKGEIDFEF